MKKFATTLLLLIFYSTAPLLADDHIREIFAQAISVEEYLPKAIASRYSIPSGLTLFKAQDTIDDLGIRHQSYRQYYNGIEVESYLLIVHSNDGQITSISGSLLQKAPGLARNRISKQSALRKVKKEVKGDENLETKIICVDGAIHEAYKYVSTDDQVVYYIDMESGEILQRIPLNHGIDISGGTTVSGTGYTLYNGVQPMDCYLKNGNYYLQDGNRNIVTLDASIFQFNLGSIALGMDSVEQDEIQQKIYAGDTVSARNLTYKYSFETYFNKFCNSIKNDESTWYYSKLASVTITSANSSWWYDIWDAKPDLYIKIFNPSGTCVYTSEVKDDATLPVTFTIKDSIILNEIGLAPSSEYVIKIYDEDVTSDAYGGSVTISDIHSGTHTWSNSSYTSGSLVISPSASGLFDVHWGMQKTYDFYKSVFNRTSYDNKGAKIYNLVYPQYDAVVFSNMPNNATAYSAYGTNFMYYGKGDGVFNNPFVTLDVMAHEFTHLVTANNGNGGLEYKEESGALNESFSDIMAMGVYQNAWGTCPWTIGAGVKKLEAAMRSLSDPHLYKDPDYYLTDQYWCTIPTAQDTNSVVVHTNSGVQNKWFYLLTEGGSGVSGIGISKALKIAYRNLMYYLAPNATYYDARFGSILAATDLYGATSAEVTAVKAAWDAVGVFDPSAVKEYFILAKRSSGNYYFLTPTKVTNRERLVAVDAGASVRTSIDTVSASSDYLWTIENGTSGVLLKSSTGQYITCTSARTISLATTGTELTQRTNSDGTYTFLYAPSDTETRYLSLATSGNDYYVFYANENQFTHVILMKKGQGTPTPVVESIAPVFNSEKFMRDGKIYILRDGVTYDIMGRKIK